MKEDDTTLITTIYWEKEDIPAILLPPLETLFKTRLMLCNV